MHVVYGLMGLNTHTKTTLVVRQEPDGIRCYVHIGTGNDHTQMAGRVEVVVPAESSPLRERLWRLLRSP